MIDIFIELWYDFIVVGFLLSAFIAYPTVALFVTRPIQRKLRKTQQDYLSDWVIWPFQSGIYAMAVLLPLKRWSHKSNRHLVEGDELVRQAATPVQWWLSLWLWVSMCGMVLLILIPGVLELLGVLPFGSG